MYDGAPHVPRVPREVQVKGKRAAKLTVERVREILRESAKGAEELRATLEREHLQGYSRSMALRLD
jgi:hypothetical protein